MNFRPTVRPSFPCPRGMMFVGLASGTFWLSGAGLCTLSAYRALPECTCEPHTQTEMLLSGAPIAPSGPASSFAPGAVFGTGSSITLASLTLTQSVGGSGG
jgi:hypothetical protein